MGLLSFSSARYADGASGAPSGTPQFPNALSGYTARPPWNVPGVDYYVGIPSGTVLKDPTAGGLPTGSSWDSVNSLVRVSGTNVVLDGWDFSVTGTPPTSGVGIYIEATATGAIIKNCKIRTQNFTYPIQAAIGSGDVTITCCLFDGGTPTDGFPLRTDTGGKSIAQVSYAGSGTLTLTYNMWQYLVEDGVDTTTPTGTNVTLLYNYNCVYLYGTRNTGHADPVQFSGDGVGSSTANGGTQSYNFIWQPHGNDAVAPYLWEAAVLAGGTPEGIQRQSQQGVSITNYSIDHNVVVADAPHDPNSGDTSGQMSYLIQIEQTTGTNSGGSVHDNYLDHQGAYGPFYTTGAGSRSAFATFSNNIDMRTGSALSTNP